MNKLITLLSRILFVFSFFSFIFIFFIFIGFFSAFFISGCSDKNAIQLEPEIISTGNVSEGAEGIKTEGTNNGAAGAASAATGKLNGNGAPQSSQSSDSSSDSSIENPPLGTSSAASGALQSSVRKISSSPVQPRIFGNKVLVYPEIYDVVSDYTVSVETTRSYSLYENLIAFSNYDGIYIYDISGKAKQKVVDASYSNFIDYYDKVIVWSEGLSVYMFNLDTKTKTRLSSTGLKPKASDKYVVWYDVRNNNKQLNKGDLYAYSLAEGVEKRVTQQLISPEDYRLAVYGSKAVFTDRIANNFDVFLIDLDSGEKKQLTNDDKDQIRPGIYSDFVVWQDYRLPVGNAQQASGSSAYDTPTQIYVYDIGKGVEKPLTNSLSGKYDPHISGKNVVWYERTGVYLVVVE